MSDYAVFDFNEMTLTFLDSDDVKKTNYKKFPIGECLVGFLNCDFSEYQKDRKLIYDKLEDEEFVNETIRKMTEKESSNAIDFTIFIPEESDPIVKLKKIAATELFSRYTNIHYYIGRVPVGISIDDIDFVDTQTAFKDMVNFCYNLDKDPLLDQLPIEKRFLIYKNIGQYSDYFFDITFPSTLLPIVDKDYFSDLFKITNIDMIPKKINQKMISRINQVNVQLNEHYVYEDYFSMLYLEFTKILSHKFSIKKCTNCGKYYVVTDNYNTEYCNYISEGEEKTCREIGAVRKYAEKVKDNPILKAYNRAYKTHFARIRYKKTTQQEFNSWALLAKEMKEKAKSGEITFEEFSKWLDE